MRDETGEEPARLMTGLRRRGVMVLLALTFVAGVRAAAGQQPVDLSGSWDVAFEGGGTASWTFRSIGGNRYAAEQRGAYATSSGTATLQGRRLRMDWTSSGPFGANGFYEWDLDPEFRAGTGRAVLNLPGSPAIFASAIRRAGAGPAAATPAQPAARDLSGTWHASSRKLGSITWTFQPLGDNRYAAVERGPGDARGTATLAGNRLRVDWTAASGAWGGYYEWDLAPALTHGTGRLVLTQGGSGTHPSSVRLQRVK